MELARRQARVQAGDGLLKSVLQLMRNLSVLVGTTFTLVLVGCFTGGAEAPTRPGVILDLGVLALSAIILEMFAVELPSVGYVTSAVAVYFAGFMLLGLPLTLIIACLALFFRFLVVFGPPSPRHVPRKAIDACSTLLPLLACAFMYRLMVGGARLLELRQLVAMLVSILAWYLVDRLLEQVQEEYVPPSEFKTWRVERQRARHTMLAVLPAGFVVVLLEPDHIMYAPALLVPLACLRLAFVARPAVEERRVTVDEDTNTALSLVQAELVEYKAQNKLVMNDLQKRVDELAILSETGQLLGASLDLQKTLDIIIQMIRKLIVYQSCVIFLMDNRSTLTPAKAVSPFKDVLELSPLLQLEEAMVSLVVQSRKPLLQYMPSENSLRIFKDEQSVMCVPMVVKNEIIGVIYVGTLRPGAYNSDHVHLLEMLASPAAIAIKSAQLFEEQEDKNRALERANAQRELQLRQQEHLKILTDNLSQAVDLKGTIRACVEKLSDIIGCRTCIVFVRQRAGESVWVVADCVSPYEAYLRNYSSTPGEGLLDYSASLRSPLLVSDARNAVTHRNEELSNDVLVNERSIMIAPLRSSNQEEATALLYLGDGEPEKFTFQDVSLFEMLSLQVAISLEKAELYEKMKEQAITDGVTGLYTHRYYQERLIEEVKWSERVRKPLSLVMVDADNFKKFNDTLGHPQGDALLKEIANLLKDACRDSDLVCRYGGDEFSLILKETDKEGARKIAERIREAFELRLGKHKVKVTSSIGVACFPTDATTKAELVKAADAALYESKRRGRNQVQLAQALQSWP